MDKNTEADISELVQLMFVGLMGAYKEVEKILKTFHDKNDEPSNGFRFYESLVHQPLHEHTEMEIAAILRKTFIFSLFPQRLAHKSLLPSNKDIVEKDLLMELCHSIFTQYTYKHWCKIDEKASIKSQRVSSPIGRIGASIK